MHPLPTDIHNLALGREALDQLRQDEGLPAGDLTQSEFAGISMGLSASENCTPVTLHIGRVTPQGFEDFSPHTQTPAHGGAPDIIVFDQGDLIPQGESPLVCVRLAHEGAAPRVGEYQVCEGAQLRHQRPTGQEIETGTYVYVPKTRWTEDTRGSCAPIDHQDARALVALPFREVVRAAHASAETLHPKLRLEHDRQHLVRLLRAATFILALDAIAVARAAYGAWTQQSQIRASADEWRAKRTKNAFQQYLALLGQLAQFFLVFPEWTPQHLHVILQLGCGDGPMFAHVMPGAWQ